MIFYFSCSFVSKLDLFCLEVGALKFILIFFIWVFYFTFGSQSNFDGIYLPTNFLY